MKTLITIVILILAINTADAKWELTNSPYVNISIRGFEKHNGIMYSISTQNKIYNYVPESDSWIILDIEIPSTISEIWQLYSFQDKLFMATDKGVFVSTDNGSNWIEKNEGLNNLDVRAILSDGNVLVAGGKSQSNKNFYISYDLGDTWYLPQLYQLPEDYFITSIAFFHSLIYIGTSKGLYYSTNKGDSWRNEWTEFSGLINDHITSFAILEKSTSTYRIYTGTDRRLILDNGKMITLRTPGGGSKYITGVAVSEDNVFVTTLLHGVYHSSDDGKTWHSKNEGLPRTDSIKASMILDDITYIGIPSEGVYESSDYGTNWVMKNTEGFAVRASVNEIILVKDIIYSIVDGSGIAHSSDNGITWDYINEGLAHLDVLYLCECNDNLYAVLEGSKTIYYKDINANKWRSTMSGAFTDDVKFLNIECHNNQIFVVEESGIYRLSNFTLNWTNVLDNSEINKIFNDEKEYQIRSKRLVNFDNNLILGTNRGMIYSDDLGENWQELDLGEDFYHFDIRSISKSGKHLFVLYDYRDINSSLERKDQIMILEFENQNRVNLDINFDKEIGAIHVVNGFIFLIATDWKSIYLSNDIGQSWEDVSLPKDVMLTGSIANNDEYIFIGTTNGVWRRNLLDFGIIVSVTENEIEEWNYLYTYPPYPMPARSEVRAKIYFDSSTEISVDNMAVYDIYGRKLPTKESLRLEQKTFYSGYIIWDCAGVEPGVYIIRINHGTEVRAVKVIIGI